MVVHKHFSERNHKFSNGQAYEVPSRIDYFKVLSDLLLNNSRFHPMRRIPEVPVNWDLLKASVEPAFSWLGHSSLALSFNHEIILHDPVFGPCASTHKWLFPRFQESLVVPESLPEISVVLISHNHYDHLDAYTLEKIHSKVKRFIVPLKNGDYLRSLGVPSHKIIELDWYESVILDDVKYTCAPAKHHSGRTLWDKNKALWSSWVVERADKKVFISGDTAYGTHFKEIADFFGGFDLAFIENGQYNKLWHDNHMFPQETAWAARDLKTKKTVPIHWGVFALSNHTWNDPIKKAKALFQTEAMVYETPLMGEIFGLDIANTSTWWNFD